MNHLTRRRFFENSVMAAAAATLPKALDADDAKGKAVSPSEKVTVAILGCGHRGKAHAKSLASLKDCQIAYICDPDLDQADSVANILTKELNYPAPKVVQDLRTIIDDPSVDAIFIATPNHWHSLAGIWAMQAGKDVYVEKPVSHNVVEGRRLVEAARKYNRICQTGTQNRSRSGIVEAVQYMHEGKLGEVKLARSIIYVGRGSIGGPVDTPMPPRLDYNLFAGPAPLDKLTRKNFHYDWHWMWHTGCGEIGNNNVHSIDICRWGLGVTGLGRSVITYGGRLGYEDVGETPNSQIGIFDFGDKVIVSETRGLKTEPYNPEIASQWFFYGTEGIIANTDLYDLDGKLVRPFEGKGVNHFANFLEAVRSRKREDLRAEIEEGHQSSSLCHIANISYRLGAKASVDEIKAGLGKAHANAQAAEDLERTAHYLAAAKVDLDKTPLTLGRVLTVDGNQEKFLNNEDANALLAREYRAPFTLPSESEL